MKMKSFIGKITKHLKGDIKGYKHEIEEDKDLIQTSKKQLKAKRGKNVKKMPFKNKIKKASKSKKGYGRIQRRKA